MRGKLLKTQVVYQRFPLIVALLLVVCCSLSSDLAVVDAGGVDGIPILSQAKSFLQWLSGDSKGAKETQENFSKQAPIVSQARSLVESAKGDNKAAKRTQEHFVDNLKEQAESTPLLGHAIGAGYIAAGDKKHGLDVIKGASSSTGAALGGIAGGILGGPAGAVAGSVAGGSVVDGIITGVESAKNKEFRPYGNIDYVANFKDKSFGEHIDQIAGMGLEAFSGKGGGRSRSRSKSGEKTKSEESDNKVNDKQDDDRPTQVGRDSRVHSHAEGASHADKDKGHARGNADPHAQDGDFVIDMKTNDGSTEQSRMNDKNRIENDIAGVTKKSLEEVRLMPENQKLKALQDSLTHLPEDVRSKLSMSDFKDVNSFRGEHNCYLCTLAGASNRMIGELAKSHGSGPTAIKKWENVNAPSDRYTPMTVVEKLFQDTEFPGAKATAYLNEKNFHDGLNQKLKYCPDGTVYKFGLGYGYAGTSSGHIKFGRAWRDGGQLKTLYTDFQIRPDDTIARYATDLPPNINHHTLLDLGTRATHEELGSQPKPKPSKSTLPGCTVQCQQLEQSKAKLAGGHLGKERSSKVSRVDLLDVRDRSPSGRCPWCVVAFYAGVTEGVLKSDALSVELHDLSEPVTVQQVIAVLQVLGHPDTQLLLDGVDEETVRHYIGSKLGPNGFTKLVLAYGLAGDKSVKTVLLTAWRSDRNAKTRRRRRSAGSTSIEYLITDFSYDPDDKRRFKTTFNELDTPVGSPKTFYLIQPKRLVEVTQSSIENDLNRIDTGDLERGTGCTHKRIIGYVAGWSTDELTLKRASRYTNLIYAFAHMSADGSLALPQDTISGQRLADLVMARLAFKRRGKRLSLSVAIGGWENSQYFSSVVADGGSRQHLLQQISQLVDTGFDGVDIDWEYPGTGGATVGRPEDRANYVEFLKQLRALLGPNKLISIAGGAGEEALRGFDVKAISSLVDWIGVMTYDFNGAWESKWGAYVGPCAALHHAAPVGYSGRLNANWAIKQYVCRSGEPSKIVMGLPFYGRFWSKTRPGKDPQNYPLFRMAERGPDGKFGGELSYAKIESVWFGAARNATQMWDERSQTPWAFATNGGEYSVLTYDDPESIAAKVAYASEHNLGGVMVWSVDQEDEAMSLSRELGKMCAPGGGLGYKCNPLGEERRWWQWVENEQNAGMCGVNAPLYKGFYARCDPDDPGFGCCGKFGYCGSGKDHCDCPECVDYTKDPSLLVKEPVKPSRPVQWHVGFEQAKPGQPRCGPSAPPVNGHYAICNPDDNHNHCCSSQGYCGGGAEFCDCQGCKNYRKLSQADSMVRARPAEEIHWHVGFDVVKPGEPRCGPSAKKVRDREATCNPDDDSGHCCSPHGFCGTGKDFCDCAGCKNARRN